MWRLAACARWSLRDWRSLRPPPFAAPAGAARRLRSAPRRPGDAAPSGRQGWRDVPWHPRLSWVLDLSRLPPSHEAFLRRLNVAIIDGGLTERVPLKYRSLQLARDEKELEVLMQSRLFGPGRLTASDLNFDPEILPMAWHRVGAANAALIFENAAPFQVARQVLSQIKDPPYGIVGCGGGNSVPRSMPYLATIEPRIEALDYVGDLDLPGLSIALRARSAAEGVGLPTVKPASILHGLMLKQRLTFEKDLGWPHVEEPVEVARLDDAVAFIETPYRRDVRELIAAGCRVPEEVLGPKELRLAWDGYR